MADTKVRAKTTAAGADPAAASDTATGGGTGAATGSSEVATIDPLAPAADRGRTRIADSVVAKISGLAARGTLGVYALGRTAQRAVGAVRERIPGARANAAQGVSVEVGEKQCAVDLAVVVQYGFPIAEVAAEVRDNVISALETMTGLEVVEVNIDVDDIHIDNGEERRVE